MPTVFDRAVALHQAGRLAEAEPLYRQAVALAPNNDDALRLLAMLLLHVGRPQQALDLLARALKLNPKSADILLSHGLACKALGRLEDAIASMRRALRVRPAGFDILYNLGNAQREAGRLADAARSFARAAAEKPDFADAHNNLGNTQRQLGQYRDAALSFRRAVALLPDAAPLHFNLATVLALDGQYEAAVTAFRDTIALAPNDAAAHRGLAEALARHGQHEAAVAAFTQALRIDPHAIATRLDLAHALTACNRLRDAEAELRAAIRIAPDNAELHSNLGNLLRDLDEDAGAVASLESALALRPDYAPARYVLGVTHLLAGRLQQGWPGYAARFAANNTAPRFPALPWRGENIAGQTLLLHAEQGLGDTLQFCRYVPLLAGRATIVLEVQAPLVGLLASLAADIRIVPYGAPLPPFDHHCPLLDLPLVFHTGPETIPANMPYLHADPSRIQAARARVATLPGRTIGLCWAGNRDYAHDDLRSVPPASLGALADIPGVSFVSLQKDAGPQPPFPITDWTADLHDFADTAALITALDLVISVDTAIAHLSGALGRPTWLLNRKQSDWRWQRDRADSPWYPTLRQFRQSRRGEWRDVIATMRGALQA